MQLIDPCRDKIRIKEVRKRGDGKITIEAATDHDLKKIIENQKLRERVYMVTQIGALNPKVVVFDVSRSLEPESMVDNALELNKTLLEGFKIEEFRSGFIPRFRIGRREN